MTPHLTHEQLCDLLLECAPHPLSSDFVSLQQHLSICPACATEFQNLSASLSLLRDAATSYTRLQPPQLDADKIAALPMPKTLFQPVYWAAAAAILVAGVLPLTLHRQTPPSPPLPAAVTAPAHTQESDEALLEEISQELSTPVPSPMRPLADPTATSSETQSATPQGITR
jgi:hypothetical protein